MRYAHICTSTSCAMPMLAKSARVESFMQRAEAQLAKGRKKPQQTVVGKYVDGKAPRLAKKLHKVLKAWAAEIAPKVAKLYAEKFEKEDTTRNARILSILDELNNTTLGEDLAGKLEGPMLAAFKRAAAVGATQVAMEFAGITEQVDEAAVAFAEKRGGELIKDLAGTTDDALKSLLARAVEDGMSADDLADEVEGLGAFGEARAEMIARTELAFAHVQGNVEGWKASDQVEGKRSILGDLHDVPDECDEAADAGVVGIDDDFGDGLDFPPYHPNCCLPGTVVAPGGRIAAQFSRWFQGEVVEIRTAKNQLSVTPNHPILTPRGWIAAGELQAGDHVLEAIDPQAASACVDPHDGNVPTCIDQVAEALLMAGGRASRQMPATTEAFHGDGMADGKVDVVWAAGALANDRETGALKQRMYARLGLRQRAGRALATHRHPAALVKTLALATHSVVSSSDDFSPALRSAPSAERELHFAERPHRQPMPLEQIAQRGAVTPEALGQIYRGLASLVESVEIVHIGKRQFAGHVYNLSTQEGWYFANAIITHNCMCDVTPVLKEEGEDE